MAAAGCPQPPSAVMDTKTSDNNQRTERGASAVEYGLLIAGITALIVIVVYAFGGVLSNVYNATCDSVGTSANAGTC
jgi:pilus assembly protein Flp/PilA